MRVRLSTILLGLAVLGAGAAGIGAFVLYAGFYNVAATHQHLAPTYALLDVGLRESVERHARSVHVPPLTDPALSARGFELYSAQCAQCHGAPGLAPAPFALGLTPLPANLAHTARERTPAQLYWVIKHGIKMTGMPAWEFRFDEPDLWALVAFVRDLPLISPEDYASRAGKLRSKPATSNPTVSAEHSPDPARGKMALRQYACTTCHVVPGVVGEHAAVGPPLGRIATRDFIAGMLPNTHANMIRWLRHPKEVNPRTAMPDLGVNERDARDMAAYLYTLK